MQNNNKSIEHNMKKIFFSVLAALLPGFFLISDCFAQATTEVEESKRSGALNLFIDCRSCDMNYTRQEIPYVNYVRDTKEGMTYPS